MGMWCYETLMMQKPKFSWEMLFFESGDTEVFKADRSSLQVIKSKSAIILQCLTCFTTACQLCVPTIVEVSLKIFLFAAVVLC